LPPTGNVLENCLPFKWVPNQEEKEAAKEPLVKRPKLTQKEKTPKSPPGRIGGNFGKKKGGLFVGPP